MLELETPSRQQPPLFESELLKTKEPIPIASVSDLTRRLRGHIEGTFSDVWVRGEISSFKKPVSGHGYFLLKDAKAQLRAVCFRGVLSKIKFQIQDGMEVNLHGSVTVYEARGEYQLVCDRIEPVGIGALQLAFEQLKARLQKEGLFESTHKKPLPFLPKRIGIVTSATGAAVRDILKVISRRFAERELFLIPVAVQGEKAAGEIAAGIKTACVWNHQNPARAIEVMIVGRGGGSLEDLWPFNEEIVARAVYECPIPIISAVGHEIDFTICDFVADVRAPTPSAAAEIVLPQKEELRRWVFQWNDRLGISYRKSIGQRRLHVSHLSRRLVDPRERIRKLKERFQLSVDRLKSVMLHRAKFTRKVLSTQMQLLDALSPLRILNRGYSVTLTEVNEVIRTAKSVAPGQVVTTRLSDGTFQSQVLSKPAKDL